MLIILIIIKTLSTRIELLFLSVLEYILNVFGVEKTNQAQGLMKMDHNVR